MQIVFDYAKDRPIIFSSFQPDAAILVRKLQSTYPVSALSFVLEILKRAKVVPFNLIVELLIIDDEIRACARYSS